MITAKRVWNIYVSGNSCLECGLYIYVMSTVPGRPSYAFKRYVVPFGVQTLFPSKFLFKSKFLLNRGEETIDHSITHNNSNALPILFQHNFNIIPTERAERPTNKEDQHPEIPKHWK